MSPLARPLVAALLVVPVASGAMAGASDQENSDTVAIPDAASVVYEPGLANLPEGTQFGRVAGNPAKPVPLVLRIRFPTDIVIAPHAQAGTLTILAGIVNHQHGTVLDRPAVHPRASAASSSCRMPSGRPTRRGNCRSTVRALRSERHRPGRRPEPCGTIGPLIPDRSHDQVSRSGHTHTHR